MCGARPSVYTSGACRRGPSWPRVPGGEPLKKLLGLFGLVAILGGFLMFWRRKQDDEAFLDEELD